MESYLPHIQTRLLAKLYGGPGEAFEKHLAGMDNDKLADVLEGQTIMAEKLPPWAYQASLDEVLRRVAQRESLQDYLGYDS